MAARASLAVLLCLRGGVRAAPAAYAFATLGDWGGVALGGFHPDTVKRVAQQLGKSAADREVQFVVNVGDNFYYCGITSTSDSQISEDYTSIYTAPALQVPWYSALGNHEYGYDVDAQVQFTEVDPTKRWYLPARYYTKRVEVGAGQHVSFIFLDTSPCVSDYRAESSSRWDPCGSEFPTCSPIHEGPCMFHSNILSQDCSKQYAWFEAQIAAVNKNDWLIVVGHHPADEMDVHDFISVMQRHGFDLYLNGHVHALQQYTIDGKEAFVTSGAGAMVNTSDQHLDPRCAAAHTSGNSSLGHSWKSNWNRKIGGFTLHTFSEDFKSLKTEFVSYSGRVLHSFSVTKAAPPPGPSPRPPSSCGGAGAWPCAKGCTYIHKANQRTCSVQKYGCYDCSQLPENCPDCLNYDSTEFV